MPSPSGMHARLIAESRAMSAYRIAPDASGRPGYVTVAFSDGSGTAAVGIHRDCLPLAYRRAQDPHGLLSRPSSH